MGQEQKAERKGGGGGERRERLPANPRDFEKPVRPRTGLLIGVAWSS